jgi:Zn-dependent protease with chaperone function
VERADFVHLVRLSEQASAEDSSGYRRSVALFAAIGYAWVLGCVVFSALALWWLAGSVGRGRFGGWQIWFFITAIGLLWSSLRALWCRLDPPEGIRLTPDDAPALFEALERIRRKVKGPRLDGVFLQPDLNAMISQRPRWGIFGRARSYLGIGLPLMMALDRQRLLAVLAHEYGHLRGDHGRFGAWIYRTRASWTRLYEGLDRDSVVGQITGSFLRWYFPRFVARTFAMARQDEYEADRISGNLLGAEAAGAALVEVAVKGTWLHQRFWRRHWAVAAQHAVPVGPFRTMRAELGLAPPPDFAQEVLRERLRRGNDLDDTHPSLRDRLETLGAGTALPSWSKRSAVELLGPKAETWIARFDKQWCSEHASAWKQHHAALARVRTRIGQLAAQGGKGATDWVLLADLQRRLNPDADARATYEQALALAPGHGGALRGLAECIPATDRAARSVAFTRLYEQSPEHRWWAAQSLVTDLEADPAHDEQALKLWRQRLKEATAAEERAFEELSSPPFLAQVGRHDLDEFALEELRLVLAEFPVARAWLLRKQLKEFPARRSYLLAVEAQGLDDAATAQVCAALQQAVVLPGPTYVVPLKAVGRPREVERQGGTPVHALLG